MDDVRAVLDAVGCQRVAVMGANEGSRHGGALRRNLSRAR